MISGICIEFVSGYKFRVQDRFFPFITEQSGADIKMYFEEREELPEFQGETVFAADNYAIYLDADDRVWRCFYDLTNENDYYAACSVGKDKKESLILYKKEGIANINHLNGAMYHVCWEKHLLNFNRMILHASCIDTVIGGILFSGPSGIGKSTQADLWCRYEDARMINGDRPIIGKDDGKWKAFGSPFAGSSNCFVNDSVVMKAVVFLKQGDSCRIRRLNGRSAFRKLIEQLTVNQWEKESMNLVCNLVMDLIEEVPIYELECTPDAQAVECLKNVIQEEQSGEE